MKMLIIAVAALVATVVTYGQGQFNLNNRIPADGINARLILLGDPSSGESSSVGSPDYSIALFGGPQGTPTAQLVPLDPATTTFRGPAGTTLAGYITQVSPTVPGVPPGASASIVLRVLSPFLPFGGSADVGPFSVTLGGGVLLPPNLPMGGNPIILVVPEPTTVALGAMGLGALLLRRRCRSPRISPTDS